TSTWCFGRLHYAAHTSRRVDLRLTDMQRAAAALFTIANLSQMIRAWQSKHGERWYWRPWQAELYPGARVGLVQAGNLGDVVHTLPMAGAIKAACPTATIVFIGRRYTEFPRCRQEAFQA